MSPKKVLTLTLVRNGSKILLGMKKRGFGEGKWNGFGGKVEGGESIEDAALRELTEECNLCATKLNKVGIMNQEFEGDPVILEIHVFSTAEYSGEVKESEEMKPCWFDIDKLPFDDMWPDDRYWYPLVIKGSCFRGYMKFQSMDKMLEYKIDELTDASSLEIGGQ